MLVYVNLYICFMSNMIVFRQIVNEKMLEGSTLDAQQEEMERKRRLEELRAKLAAQHAAVSKLQQLEPEV